MGEITAAAEDGWHFDRWTGDVADPASAATTVTVASDVAVTVLFQRSWLMYWVTGGSIAAAAVVGVFVWLAVRRRRPEMA